MEFCMRVGSASSGRNADAHSTGSQLLLQWWLKLQGWVNDVTLLRKQIAAVDRRLKQSWVCGRLPDDERRDQILDRHYR